ncbi:unnamed protein product [Strongylus vulgaris]|uniref:Uncharacterized protein n=1 Tax=Strongylus vulgaris TaxID=40348 RepID=A0A3P7KKC7_STRVU|nr:unnamed protein product [Strongylus vulgaris]
MSPDNDRNCEGTSRDEYYTCEEYRNRNHEDRRYDYCLRGSDRDYSRLGPDPSFETYYGRGRPPHSRERYRDDDFYENAPKYDAPGYSADVSDSRVNDFYHRSQDLSNGARRYRGVPPNNRRNYYEDSKDVPYVQNERDDDFSEASENHREGDEMLLQHGKPFIDLQP